LGSKEASQSAPNTAGHFRTARRDCQSFAHGGFSDRKAKVENRKCADYRRHRSPECRQIVADKCHHASERAIVSELPGTTRDAIDISYQRNGEHFYSSTPPESGGAATFKLG